MLRLECHVFRSIVHSTHAVTGYGLSPVWSGVTTPVKVSVPCARAGPRNSTVACFAVQRAPSDTGNQPSFRKRVNNGDPTLHDRGS